MASRVGIPERFFLRGRPSLLRAGLAAMGIAWMVTVVVLFIVNPADPALTPETTEPPLRVDSPPATDSVSPVTTQTLARDEAPLAAGSWDLVLSEDFSAGELDKGTWSTCYWWDEAGCTIATNEELEWYLPDNVAVSDGVLTLSAIREDTVGVDGRSYPFSSGMVSTGPASYKGPAGFAFTYGYVEMRARVPSGRGLWPAFWMLPNTFESKPEIDIMQVLGDDPTRLHVHVHTVDTTGAVKHHGANNIGPDLTADWHVYGLSWTKDELIWYLDDAEVWRYDGTDIPTEPMYLVANLAVGGNYAGTPDPATVFPATYQIDSIRIWREQ